MVARMVPRGVAWPAVGIVGLGVAAFIVSSRAWTFLCDDAFISFRYADNLARHGALVFNPSLPERVEGYTNFLWVVVLGALARLGVPPPEAAAALTVLAAAVGLVALTALVRALRRQAGDPIAELRPVDGVPALLCAVQPEYMVWSHSGLETSAATALVLGAAWAFTTGRVRTAALLAAAAGLTRPDALVPIAVFGLVWIAVRGVPVLRREGTGAIRSLAWRPLGLAALLFCVPLLAHLLWRHAYYGEWLPNTWTVKVHGRLLRDTWGADYVRAWVSGMHLGYFAPLAILVRPRHLLLLLPGAAVLGYAWWVGGDFMAYGRFVQVATACLFGAVGWMLADAERRLAALSGHGTWLAHAPLAIALGLVAVQARSARARWEADRAQPTGWLDGRWEGVTTMDRFARVGWAVGRWMQANLPPDTLVTVGAAGAVPYGSQLPTLDAFGLVDPAIARMPDVKPRAGKGGRPGHQLYAPIEYIRQRDPDLLCHVGYRGSTRPTRRHVQRGFDRGYAWACIEPPPEPSPTVEGDGLLEVGFYCCRRPVDRAVGPFAEGTR